RVFLERRRLREEDVVGWPAVDVLGESFFSALKPYLDRALTGETVSFDMPAEYPDGMTRQLHVSYFPLRDRDSIQGVVSHIRDITELKRKEEELRAANAEKDFLMDELNHRVKNNLAMITALINMKDAALGEVADLSDIRNQINAVRIVHDRLQHHGGSSSVISLGRYVDDLLDAVFELSAWRPVTVTNRIGELGVSTRQAVTLGLILSELATNAMKHGFREGEEARFEVGITNDGDSQQHVMTVSNSGRPFPEDVDINAPGGTGLRLVSSLVSQLGGTIERTPTPSANFRITLNLER
ncbi:MAG: histidine kinase dimerization/phosphoacceptor domain -containing protein, partial [Spirochaetia bacterium]